MINVVELTNKYLKAFELKDLKVLSELYSEDVVLNEWDENVFVGKEAVLEANRNLFEKFATIYVRLDNQGCCKSATMNQLVVSVENETESLRVRVVDVIHFDESTGAIKLIFAYRGF